jgi:hypothetical protein
MDKIDSFGELGGMEILQIDPENNIELIERLKNLFHIQCPSEIVQVRQVIKRDKGFTPLSCHVLNIPSDSIIICLNESQLPSGYGFYNIAQDYTGNNLPWIHLYHFPPSRAISVLSEHFDKLSLTPVEEIIFRDIEIDILNASAPFLKEKIVTKINIFAFPQNCDWSQ